MKFSYHVEGMHCIACVDKIKSVLSPHFQVSLTLDPPLLTIEAAQTPNLIDLNNDISSVGKYKLHPIDSDKQDNTKINLFTYYPIFLITGYILGVAAINNIHWQAINWQGLMQQFMAGFFLVFSAFKLLDIHGFAEAYATYDLLAKRWQQYGYIYPFLELSLGFLYLTMWLPRFTLVYTIALMGFSSIGVINSLVKKQKFQCACLGTVLKVPLSSVTLIEDLSMVVLALFMLLM